MLQYVTLQTQLSIYADKNHVLFISEKFCQEATLSFLLRSQAVKCLQFKPQLLYVTNKLFIDYLQYTQSCGR